MTRINLSGNAAELWTWDFGPISERVLIEHPEVTDGYPDYERELRKFFGLIALNNEPLAMISPRIDCLWHALIMFTPLYREFCNRIFGFFIDHVPRTQRTQISESAIWNFFSSYRREYGDIPSCWFDGLAPSTVETLRNGEVPSDLLWSGWVPPRHLKAQFWGRIVVAREVTPILPECPDAQFRD